MSTTIEPDTSASNVTPSMVPSKFASIHCSRSPLGVITVTPSPSWNSTDTRRWFAVMLAAGALLTQAVPFHVRTSLVAGLGTVTSLRLSNVVGGVVGACATHVLDVLCHVSTLPLDGVGALTLLTSSNASSTCAACTTSWLMRTAPWHHSVFARRVHVLALAPPLVRAGQLSVRLCRCRGTRLDPGTCLRRPVLMQP